MKKHVKHINIAYIGGGSKGWAWGLMSDLAREEEISGTVTLYDIDIESAISNAIIGNRLKERKDVVGDWEYKVASTLEEALVNADFVIISILPGTFDEMEVDVHLPEKYGVYQSVGDTAGPGGLMRALRTIPMIEEIGIAIKAFAPKAWVINFTNPMAICVRTLYSVFPDIKAFGNCHEVFGTQKLLACALEDIKGVNDVKREDIKVNVLGVNHFTWITHASYNTVDLFPIYKEFVNRYYDTGFESEKTGNWLNDLFSSASKVKFELFRQYGYIAAAGDRHLAEFCSKSWFLKNPETVKAYKFSLTPVSWRKENQKNLLEKAKRLRNNEEIFELKETGEEGVKQIKALLGLGDLVTNVNLPNEGQISNLPEHTIVETNALFQRNRLSAIHAGDVPLEIMNMLNCHVVNQELILKAGLERNKELAFKAFIQEPLMQIDREDARQCFDDMLKNTSKFHQF